MTATAIKDAMKKEMDENVTLMVQCIAVSELIKTGTKNKFFAVIGDSSASTTCTVYDEKHLKNFKPGSGIFLQNILNKQSYMALTSRSKSGLMPPRELPQDILDNAPKLPKDGLMTLKTSLASPAKSYVSVKGKVVKVSPAGKKHVSCNNEMMRFQEVLLKDKTATVKVALWNNLVDTLSAGDLVHLKRCRVRLFQGEAKKLTSTIQTQMEILNTDENLDDVSMNLSPEEEAIPFEVQAFEEKGTLIALTYAECYFTCYKQTCSNAMAKTILTDDGTYVLKCPTCATTIPTAIAGEYCMARFIVQMNDTSCQEHTLFLPVIKDLFNIRGLAFDQTMNVENLQEQLMNLLPLEVRFTSNNKIINTVA